MSKYKATTCFSVEIAMVAGEVRYVPDGVAKSLVDCGYLVAVEKEKPERKAKSK